MTLSLSFSTVALYLALRPGHHVVVPFCSYLLNLLGQNTLCKMNNVDRIAGAVAEAVRRTLTSGSLAQGEQIVILIVIEPAVKTVRGDTV